MQYAIILLSFTNLISVLLACGFTRVLPIQILAPGITSTTGNKRYPISNVPTLARRLVTDIKGLPINHANVIAEDAMNIDENFVIEYSFYIKEGEAKLDQFKVTSTMGNKNVDISWLKMTSFTTYTAQTEIEVHARRRRRIVGGGRRRCTVERHNRGITAQETAKIQSELTAVLRTSKSNREYFVKVASRLVGITPSKPNFKKAAAIAKAKGNMAAIAAMKTCPHWKISFKTPMQRSCFAKP